MAARSERPSRTRSTPKSPAGDAAAPGPSSAAPKPRRSAKAAGDPKAAEAPKTAAKKAASAKVSPAPEGAPTSKAAGKTPTGKRKVGKGLAKPKVERPDELSRETFEFIAAIDEHKRRTLTNHLGMADVLGVLRRLGYRRSGDGTDEETFAREAIERYKRAHKRLFPNWSEVFGVLREEGYERVGDPGESAA